MTHPPFSIHWGNKIDGNHLFWDMIFVKKLIEMSLTGNGTVSCLIMIRYSLFIIIICNKSINRHQAHWKLKMFHSIFDFLFPPIDCLKYSKDRPQKDQMAIKERTRNSHFSEIGWTNKEYNTDIILCALLLRERTNFNT